MNASAVKLAQCVLGNHWEEVESSLRKGCQPVSKGGNYLDVNVLQHSRQWLLLGKGRADQYRVSWVGHSGVRFS